MTKKMISMVTMTYLQKLLTERKEEITHTEYCFLRMQEAKKNNNPMRYLDWHQLFKIVHEHPEIHEIRVGLKEDKPYTIGTIYKDKQWQYTDYGTYYVESIWATPVAVLYGCYDVPFEKELCTLEKQYSERVYEGESEQAVKDYLERYTKNMVEDDK